MNHQKLTELLSKDSFCVSLLMLFIFSIMSLVIYLGVPFGADFPQHFQFALTYFESIKSGNFFPGWSAQENYGYGGIGLRVYPPSAHYLLALIQLVTNDWFTTAWINIFIWLALGSIGIYFLAKDWLSPQNSLFVGMLYAFAPYHLAQVFKDFLYSEFVAAAILPFCFLYLKRICQKNDIKDVLKLSFFLALLIFSHIPTTIMGVISFAIFTLILMDWKRFFSISGRLLLAGAISISGTSFYWLKLVTEMGLINVSDSKYASGYFHYSLHLFPRIGNTSEVYFRMLMWLNDSIALFTLLFILPFVIFIVLKSVKSKSSIPKDYLAVAITGSFAFFMATTLSSFVWENFQFIQKIQFPFRWLSVASVFGCLMFVMAFSQISVQKLWLKTSIKYALTVFFLLLFLFNISQIIIPAEILSRPEFDKKLDGLLESQSYEWSWTIWSKIEAMETKEKVVTTSRQSNITKWDSELREFEIEAGTPLNARIATYYYPHWQATINGQPVKIARNDDGTMAIPIPETFAKVSVQFVEPPIIKIAKFISLLTWLLLIFFTVISVRKSAAFPIKSVQ